LEVGTGFHPELTGRENIYLNGAILGMSRAEIDRQVDELAAFAEIEKFIDTPVKHHSSGMGLRLGFAVAAHLEPEILVVDEVLAVGDVAFQKKCLGKMSDVAGKGQTVLFVSHDLGAIASLSSRSVLLEEGCVKAVGKTTTIIDEYLSQVLNSKRSIRRVDIDKTHIESASIITSDSIEYGETISIEVLIISKEEAEISLEWRLKDERGHPIVYASSYLQYGRIDKLKKGENRFIIVLGPLYLVQGDYSISLDINMPYIKLLDSVEDCLRFSVRQCALNPDGRSIKASWNKGCVVLPFEVRRL